MFFRLGFRLHRLSSCGLESERRVHARAVDGFVTTGGPASPLTQAVDHCILMQFAADINLSVPDLLEVAFQAEVRVANRQQFGVYRTVRGMADSASFAQGFVFKHIRTALCGMAAKAALVCGSQRGAASPVNGTFVRRMAGRAAQPLRLKLSSWLLFIEILFNGCE